VIFRIEKRTVIRHQGNKVRQPSKNKYPHYLGIFAFNRTFYMKNIRSQLTLMTQFLKTFHPIYLEMWVWLNNQCLWSIYSQHDVISIHISTRISVQNKAFLRKISLPSRSVVVLAIGKRLGRFLVKGALKRFGATACKTFEA